MQLHGSCGAGNEMDAGAVPSFALRIGSCESNTAAIVRGENIGKQFICALDEARRAAKVGRQMCGVEIEWQFAGEFQPEALDALKQLGIGVAKKVNGLHRIPDDEAGAIFMPWPRSDEVRKQLVLATACVLELVDQQVANAVGDGNSGVAGFPQNRKRNLRNLGKVDQTGFTEDNAKLGGSAAKQPEAGSDDLPLVVGIAG
jgi:hypothetical protein